MVCSTAKTSILVLGGTSESLVIGEELARRGRQVLISRATRIAQTCQGNSVLRFRYGALDREGLVQLGLREEISAIIDCTHPYARIISRDAYQAAQTLEVPFLVYDRPGTDPNIPGIIRAEDHPHAAGLACMDREIVFLSIGTRNISTYADRAGIKGVTLFARVLPGEDALNRCLKAGLSRERVIQARGPFSTAQNIEHINWSGAKILVTKDSGEAGGVPAKIESARRLGIRLIMVKRPPRPGNMKFGNIEELIYSLDALFVRQPAS